MIDAHQFEPSRAGNGLSSPPLLPPLVRFIVASVWTTLVFWGCGFVYAFFPQHNLAPGVVFRLIACVLTIAGFLFFLRVLDYNFYPLPVALGLPLDRIASLQWCGGFGLGALLIALDVLGIACFGSIQFHVHHARHMLVRFVAVTLLLFFGALLEELSFRGYPFQKLTEAFGAFWAVIVLSAIFGAVHLWNPDAQGFLSWGFFNTLAVGVLFALARIRTGSLWFSFGFHFSWNFFQGAIFGLPVSGLSEFSTYVTSRTQGSAALTGASYGPEASATCAIVLVMAIPALWSATSSRIMQHKPPSQAA